MVARQFAMQSCSAFQAASCSVAPRPAPSQQLFLRSISTRTTSPSRQ